MWWARTVSKTWKWLWWNKQFHSNISQILHPKIKHYTICNFLNPQNFDLGIALKQAFYANNLENCGAHSSFLFHSFSDFSTTTTSIWIVLNMYFNVICNLQITLITFQNFLCLPRQNNVAMVTVKFTPLWTLRRKPPRFLWTLTIHTYMYMYRKISICTIIANTQSANINIQMCACIHLDW